MTTTPSRWRLWRRRRHGVAAAEWGILAALLASIAATNRWLGFNGGYQLVRAHDELDYRAIAAAAPRFPAVALQEQHAQRFPAHYLVGLIARGLNIDIGSVYIAAALLIALILCFALAAVLARLTPDAPTLAVCLAVFVLNPYILRYSILAPGEFDDLLFELGTLAMLIGLLDRRYRLVVTGIAFATLARQTAVPVSVVAALWLWFDPGFADAAMPVRVTRSFAVVGISVGLYLVLEAAAASFSAPTTPDLAHFTALAELEHLPSGLAKLGQHILRSVNGLVAVAALIIAAGLVRRRVGPGRPSLPFWGCVGVGLAIAFQPLVFSADYAAHNETRLAVLALPPFVIALAALLADPSGPRLPRRWAPGIVLVLFVGSFHHLYTIVGTHTASQTVVLQFVTAALAGGALWWATRDIGSAQRRMGR